MLRLQHHRSSSPGRSSSSVESELQNTLAAPMPSFEPTLGHRHAGNVAFRAAGPRKMSCPGAAPSQPGWLRTPVLRDALCSQWEQKRSGAKKNARSYKKAGEQRDIHGELQSDAS